MMKRNLYSWLLAVFLFAGPCLTQGHAQGNSQKVSEGVTTTEVTTPDGTREITIHIASASLQQPHHDIWSHSGYSPGHNSVIAPAITLALGQKMDLKIDVEKDKPDYSQCFFLNKDHNNLSLFTIEYGSDNMLPDDTHLSPRAEPFTDDPRSRWFSWWSSYYQSWTAKNKGTTMLILNGILGETDTDVGLEDDDSVVSFRWTGSLKVPVTVVAGENTSENVVE